MTKHPNTLIRASAGTGKTFQLSNRYLSLLAEGVAADQILATTFTRKAAGEILDRIMLRLAEAALNVKSCHLLSDFIECTSLTRKKCLRMLTTLTRQLHRLHICTLDSFFSQLAGSFSLELGLPPGWKIIEEIHDAQLRTQAIERLLAGGSVAEVSRLVNLLTKGDAERSVSELLRSTVNSLYNTYLETDADAWRQFPESQLLSKDRLAQTVEDLRGTSLPSDKRFESARDADWQAAESGDWETFISKGIAAKVLVGEKVFYRKPIPKEAVDIYGLLLRHAKAVIVTQLAQQTAATHEMLGKFDGFYSELKHDGRALRFEDITRSLVDFTASGDIQRQQFRLDATLTHLLLDEFQDTSLAQWQVLAPLATLMTGKQESSFFCVGDVKQAIYGWRGGRSEIFDALEANLSGLQNKFLDMSFRSAQPIIDTVNDVFTRIDKHPNLENRAATVRQWCAKFKKHTTSKTELSGYVQLVAAPEKEGDEDQLDVTLRYAAQRVAEIVQQAPGFSVGVLTRRNKVVAKLIFELRRLGINASEEGGNPLTDSAAVQVVLSLLKLADNPSDTVARFHVSQSPLGAPVGITNSTGDETVLAQARTIRRALLVDGYGQLIYRWAEFLAPSCNARDRNRLQQLVELAFGFQPLSTLRTTEFLRYVEHQRVSDPTAANVRVMTVHQAKGLQFDVVVLPDLDDDLVGQRSTFVVGRTDPTKPVDRVCLYRNESIQSLLPDELKQIFEDAIHERVNESLCRLYVALTRAVHALYIIVTPSRRNERNLPKTTAGLLRAALTDGQKNDPGSVAYEHGDQLWHKRETDKRRSAEPQETTKDVEPPIEFKLRSSEEGRTVGLDYTSPSSLEGGSQVRVSRILQLESSMALARGTLIHAWFELIEWLDDGWPEETRLREVAEQIDTAGLNVNVELQRFHELLKWPSITAPLQRSFYKNEDSKLRPEVYNERRFVVVDDDRLMSGSVDRLVLFFNSDQIVAADVFDFKTDVVEPDSVKLEEAVEHYRPQIEAYRRAVSAMFHIPTNQVSGRLLFVTPGIVKIIGSR